MTPDTVGASTIGGEPYISSLNDRHGVALDSVTDRRQQQAGRDMAKIEAEQARIAAALRKQEIGDARIATERNIGKWIECYFEIAHSKGLDQGEIDIKEIGKISVSYVGWKCYTNHCTYKQQSIANKIKDEINLKWLFLLFEHFFVVLQEHFSGLHVT